MATSLRVQLLTWVLAPLAELAAINATVGFVGARHAANLVTDRTILASARSIAEQAHLEDGTIQLTVPPAAIEMFDNGAGDFVYYAATGIGGELLAGVSGLPSHPARKRWPDGSAFQAAFRGRRLRLITVHHPLTGAGILTAVGVTVGVTLHNRDALARRLWFTDLAQQTTLMLAAGVLMAFGLKRGLTPLMKLRDTVLARPPDSLDPLEVTVVQEELRPLVTAINRQLTRVREQMAAQHRFVANAAHQLRTPLTLVNLQASYALRQLGTADARTTLEAIRTSTEQLSRLAGQLLTLSRAEPGGRRPRRETVRLGELAARIVESLAEAAFARNIDIGMDARSDATVQGDATLIGEMLVNMVDNAIRYCPPGCSVTVVIESAEGMSLISVRDDGPGVPASELTYLFERFYRVPGTVPDGSGLGLAIVREVADAMGGEARAMVTPGGGLVIEVSLPASSPVEPRPKAD